MGGSDKEVNLWTADGIKIGNICKNEGWVWSCKSKPNQPFIAIGSADGTISMHQIQFNSVQGMYRDKYAYRQNMTDVVIQNLATNQQSRIKCRSHVRKISIYKEILVVQTSSRIFIYEMFKDEPGNTLYRIKEKINKTIECDILIATSQKLLASKDSTLEMISFEGEKEHEWTFEAPIRYVKTIGGPKGSEALLVGLRNGSVIKLFVDNHFQIPIIKHNFPIVCLDINLSRQKIAVVDDNSNLLVFDINSKELLFQEPNANSVAWNLELDDSISYAGNGLLSVKVGNFPPYQEKLNGFVVGFKGASVFCLSGYQISKIEIPQTIPLDTYIDSGNYELAYQIACLGVPDSDWKRLARIAMEQLELEIAEKAYIRVRDFKSLEAIRNIMKVQKEDKHDNDVLSAEVLAFTGGYHEVRY
jgi:intraflagellar transport protein 122